MKHTLGASLLIIAATAQIHCAGRDAMRTPVVAMASAADGFLSALSDEQRGRASFAFDVNERTRWHFVPPESFPRGGVALTELDEAQRAAAHVLLQSGLSQRGYVTATAILQLEDVLKTLEGGRGVARDSSAYFVSVFGAPSATGCWAWRFEGHHLSLHCSIVDGDITVSTPSFFGANPAEVREGPQRGRRALAPVEDTARALLESLDAEQRASAILSDAAPGDILTGTALPAVPVAPLGLLGKRMTAPQQVLLRALLEAHAGMMSADIASKRWERIEADGLARVGFAWAGAVDRGRPHYYRVQGPSFVVEYDNTQNDANHIHVVWRDFDGDFGRDLLRDHLRDSPHEKDAR